MALMRAEPFGGSSGCPGKGFACTARAGASLTWLKPAFILGPDARQLTRAVSNLMTPKLPRSAPE